MHSFIHSFIHSSHNPFIHSFIHPFIHSFIYSFNLVHISAKHHAIAAKLTRTFKPGSKPLVFQYEVKLQSENSCGGAYVKLLSLDPTADFTKFHDKTAYTIMFGPDRCGTQERFHFILRLGCGVMTLAGSCCVVLKLWYPSVRSSLTSRFRPLMFAYPAF